MEAEQFGVDAGGLLVELALLDGGLAHFPVSVGDGLTRCLVRGIDLAPPGREVCRGRHRVKASLGKQVSVPPRTCHTAVAGLPGIVHLPVKLREPVAAMPRTRDFESGLPLPETFQAGRKLVAAESQPGPFRIQIGQQPLG